MKQRKKKYNSSNYDRVKAKRLLQNYYVFFVGGTTGTCRLYSRKTKKIIDAIPLPVSNLLINMRFKWETTLVCLTRDQLGENTYALAEATAPNYVLQEQISSSLAEEHRELINSINTLHLCNIAWVSHVADPVDEEAVKDILKQCNAWDFPSKWEQERDKNIKKEQS